MTRYGNRSGFAGQIWAPLALLVGIALVGCSSPAGTSAPQATTPAKTTTPATATAGPPASSAALLTVDPGELVKPGDLTICTDVPAAPYEYYNAAGELVGLEIDIAKELGRRTGLAPVFVNSVFDTILLAVTTRKCDIVVAGISITPERLEQIDMVPYFNNAEAFLTQKGNPSGLGDPASDPLTLCGKRAVVNPGSTEADYMAEYDSQCKAAGKPAITITQVDKVPDALLQLTTNHADVFHIGLAAAGYYVVAQPGAFEIVGGSTHPTARGIGLRKEANTLEQAIIAALKAMQADGTYDKIMEDAGLPPQTPPPL